MDKHFTPPGDENQDLIGSPIASASSIIVDRMIHHVTGTGTISTIAVPYEGFCGPIFLIPDGIFSWDTAGNIALGGVATVGKAVAFLFDRKSNKWYPSEDLAIPEPGTIFSVQWIDAITYTIMRIAVLDPASPTLAGYFYWATGGPPDLTAELYKTAGGGVTACDIPILAPYPLTSGIDYTVHVVSANALGGRSAEVTDDTTSP